MQGVNGDARDTKHQLYLHPYDEGKRNIHEFKRLTLYGLRNLEMMKSCWNEFNTRTTEWAELNLTTEDQLTIQRNWNLHPRNPNPNLTMTRLKDTYWSGEERHLGNTGQVRMEAKAVTAPVMSALVIYAAASKAPTWTALAIADCEDTPPGQLLRL